MNWQVYSPELKRLTMLMSLDMADNFCRVWRSYGWPCELVLADPFPSYEVEL
jgi:hypothetical protein